MLLIQTESGVFKLLFTLFASFMLTVTLVILATFLVSQSEPLQQSDNATSLIAFYTPKASQGVAGIVDLVILNPVTREEKRFSLEPGWTEPSYLAWSPDYRKLLITYNAGTGSFYATATFDVESGEIETLASDPYESIVSGSYAPAGTAVYILHSIISASAFTSVLHILLLQDGIGQAQHITEDELYILGASWSPIEGLLAYTAYYQQGSQARAKFGSEIFLIDLGRHISVNMTKTPFQEYFASWSPDGSSFLYTSDQTGKRELYLMESNARNQRRLSETEDPLQVAYGQWTNDGRRVIYLTRRYTFANNRNTPWKPMQFIGYDLDTDQKELILERNWIGGLDFSPDRDQIAYTSSETDLGLSQLCVLDINTREEWCAEHEILPASAIAWGID